MERVLFDKKGIVFMGFVVLFGFMLLSAIVLSGVVSGLNPKMTKMEEAVREGTFKAEPPESDPQDHGKDTNVFFKEIGKEEVWTHFGNDDIQHAELWKKINSDNRKEYAEEGLNDYAAQQLYKLWEVDKTYQGKYMEGLFEDTNDENQATFEEFIRDVIWGDREIDKSFKFADGALDKVEGISFDKNGVLQIEFKDGKVGLPVDNLKDVKSVEVLDGEVELTMKNGGKYKLMPGNEFSMPEHDPDSDAYMVDIDGDKLTVGKDGQIRQIKEGYEYGGDERSAKVTLKNGFTVTSKDDLRGEVVSNGKRVTVKNGIVHDNGLDGEGKDFTQVVGDKSFSFDTLSSIEEVENYKGDGRSVGLYEYGEEFWENFKGMYNLPEEAKEEFLKDYGSEGIIVTGDAKLADAVRLKFDKKATLDIVGMSKVEKGVSVNFQGQVEKGKPVLIGDAGEPGTKTGQISAKNLEPYSLSEEGDMNKPRVVDPSGGGSGGGESGGGGSPPGGGGSPPGGGGESESANPEIRDDLGNPAGEEEECIASAEGFENCPADPERPWIPNCVACSGVSDEMGNALSGSLNLLS